MQIEEILRIHVKVDPASIISLTSKKNITFIPFTGTAGSKYFIGKILPGGVDVQVSDGAETTLSARYILEGTDIDGQSCKIYIDNTGKITGVPFKTQPQIITDSDALDFLNTEPLAGEGILSENGITIIIGVSI